MGGDGGGNGGGRRAPRSRFSTPLAVPDFPIPPKKAPTRRRGEEWGLGQSRFWGIQLSSDFDGLGFR